MTLDSDRAALVSRAYELARRAREHGNHPFGALLARHGEILLESENEVVTTRDVTRHAETALIARATATLDADIVRGAELVTSTEPCIMCCGAIHWAGVPRVVFGVRARRMVETFAGRYDGIPCAEVFARINPRVEILGPVDEDEGLAAHRAFWPGFLRSKDRR